MTDHLGTILHISDLHVGDGTDLESEADYLIADLRRQLPLDAERLRGNLRVGGLLPGKRSNEGETSTTAPDICIVSGDIASSGLEYEAADRFLSRLAADLFEGQRERMILVPGNHDVNWSASEMAYERIEYSREAHERAKDPASPFRCRSDGPTNELFRRRDDLYDSRFRRFVAFYDKFYGNGRTYSLTPSHDFNIHVVNRRVVVVGFNSNTFVDHLNATPAIRKQTIFQAAQNLEQRQSELDEDAIRIAVWHHGLFSGDKSLDYLPQSIVETLAMHGFCLALHGHTHEAQHRNAQSALGWPIPIIGAGSLRAGAGTRPESIPRQYNVVGLFDSQVVVYSRRRKDTESPWMADPGWSVGPAGWESAENWVRVSALPRAPRKRATTEGDKVAAAAGPSSKRLAAISAETAGKAIDDSVRAAARKVVARVEGVGLEDLRFLFGRQYQLKYVLEQVLTLGANKCIEGPQWVGKTSFLQALCDQRVRDWVKRSLGGFDDRGASWCYVDLRDYRTEDLVAQAVSDLIAKTIGLKGAGTALPDLLTLVGERKRRLVLVLDHFEALLARDRFEGAFPDRLRASSGGGFNVVYAMRTEALVPRSGREKAHYFGASVEWMDFFDEAASRAMVADPLRLAGYAVTSEVIDEVFRLGGRHPYFLAVARQMYAKAWESLEAPDCATALEKASADFGREVQPIYDGLLNGLTDFGHELLRGVLLNNRKAVLRELLPIVDANGIPFSEHMRQYYLSYYWPRRAERLGGEAVRHPRVV